LTPHLSLHHFPPLFHLPKLEGVDKKVFIKVKCGNDLMWPASQESWQPAATFPSFIWGIRKSMSSLSNSKEASTQQFRWLCKRLRLENSLYFFFVVIYINYLLGMECPRPLLVRMYHSGYPDKRILSNDKWPTGKVPQLDYQTGYSCTVPVGSDISGFVILFIALYFLCGTPIIGLVMWFFCLRCVQHVYIWWKRIYKNI
jgi:hypothetical protein